MQNLHLHQTVSLCLTMKYRVTSNNFKHAQDAWLLFRCSHKHILWLTYALETFKKHTIEAVPTEWHNKLREKWIKWREKKIYDKIVDKKNIVCIFFLIFFLLLRLVQLRLHFNCAHCGVCVFVHSIQNDHYDFWRWLRATFQHSRFHIDTNFIATICVATMLLLLWFVGVVQNKKKNEPIIH